MLDSRSNKSPAAPIEVSPNNPCPFLRALVAEGLVDGHTVPLAELSEAIKRASGDKGLKRWLHGVMATGIALFANGHPFRSWRSGAKLDELRDGPLDKHGAASRILDASAHVREDELARLATFGKERTAPDGSHEIGLTESEIKLFMKANRARAKDNWHWYYRLFMLGEWPVLLNVLGKGEGKNRYLSVAEVQTLFVERRLPERIVARLKAEPVSKPRGKLRKLAKLGAAAAALGLALLVAIAEIPDHLRAMLPEPVSELLPPPLPVHAPLKAAHWLDQRWSTEDRHWFHHVSQGTATFPVPYRLFIALEQPYLQVFGQPGLLAESSYLERFGFLPSPKSIHQDEASLGRFGYAGLSNVKTDIAPAGVPRLQPTAAENIDGLPVGFARMTGVVNPATGQPEADKIGLTCAACHTGHVNYKGVSVRFDGGPGMLELRKLEKATGLSILYTLINPIRYHRFATRVLGPHPDKAERDKLWNELWAGGKFVLNQIWTTWDIAKRETEEGFGRLDALNRIGNQVFTVDLAYSGLSGYEKNLRPVDAPVSFPPVWTVPWLLWAQYDASIEQPLIRNAGEALGVSALLNTSPDFAKETLFRSSVAVENLVRIEDMLRGTDPFTRKAPSSDRPSFGGLASPKWPSHLFADDPAWKIDDARVGRGRKLYAQMCAECHLGPVEDAEFDRLYPEQNFWTSPRWDRSGPVLRPVQKPVEVIGTDPSQANVLAKRPVKVPGFLDLQPARDLGERWNCSNVTQTSTTEMPFSLALMIAVDRTTNKWMDDQKFTEEERKVLAGARKNCPNRAEEMVYRARPLNGVWATAPYLHNGSVPSLYWLLRPAAERPKQFCMGDRDFDPQQVGFRIEEDEANGNKKITCKPGETKFSATNSNGEAIHGNSVLGHSFEGTAPDRNSVIGRLLADEERFDLLEYLKTL